MECVLVVAQCVGCGRFDLLGSIMQLVVHAVTYRRGARDLIVGLGEGRTASGK